MDAETIMSMPWYGWAGIGAGAFVALAAGSMRSWRKQLADDLVAYLGHHLPDWRVEARSTSKLVLRNDAGDAAEFSLFNLRDAASRVRGDAATQARAREELFATAVSAFQEQVALLARAPDPEGLLARVFPRVVNAGFKAGLPGGVTMPHRPLGDTSLLIVYVIDSTHAVAYIDDARMRALGMDEAALYARALANLRGLWPVEATRQAVENRNLVVTKALDTYDAARLLLLPERLRDDEAMAALIPDRDTLVLAPVPRDGDWSRLHRLARSTSGRELFDRALHVSPAGIRVA